MAKVILYIATSLDGFVADKNGGVDWLPQPSNAIGDCGYADLMARISIILMGSRSYHQILGFGAWAWSDKITYVFTTKRLSTEQSNISFVHEDVRVFLEKLKSQQSNTDIWLLGGAELIKSFSKEKLIDECIITIIPINLGDGIKLELPYDDFTLIRTNSYALGITQQHYKINQT